MHARLLLLFAALAGVSIATWYLVRDKPPQAPPSVKTTAELLIGTWKIVEQEDRPLPPNVTAITEFTEDSKSILRLAGGDPSLTTGSYELKGDMIRFDYEDGTGGPLFTWKARIESITDDRLVLVGIDGKPKKAVYERQRGN